MHPNDEFESEWETLPDEIFDLFATESASNT